MAPAEWWDVLVIPSVEFINEVRINGSGDMLN